MSINDISAKQVDIILEEIATTANALNQLLIDLSMQNSSAYAIRSIVERIGFLADLGLEKIDGQPRCVGDAIAWMLPEIYRDAEKDVELSHG